MAFLKDSLKYVPGVGWTQFFQGAKQIPLWLRRIVPDALRSCCASYPIVGSIYLKRTWEQDKGPLAEKLAEMENGVYVTIAAKNEDGQG